MTVLLDTSLLIAGYDPGNESVAVSVISLGELRVGVLGATDASVRAARVRRLDAIASGTEILPVTAVVAAHYAALRDATGRTPTNDLWIAATAAANAIPLFTADRNQARLPLDDVQYSG